MATNLEPGNMIPLTASHVCLRLYRRLGFDANLLEVTIHINSTILCVVVISRPSPGLKTHIYVRMVANL